MLSMRECPVYILLLLASCGNGEVDNQDSPVSITWEQTHNPLTGQGSYSIAYSGEEIMVRLKLQLVGTAVSDEIRERYAAGIEDVWSTSRFDIPITFYVAWDEDEPDKVIRIVDGHGHRWTTSTWYTDGWIEQEVAHEAGHYFGLYDEYGGGDAQGYDGGAAPPKRPAHPPGLMRSLHAPTLDYYYDGFILWYLERRNDE